ncbi:tyrosine-type recombinase/integrase [Aromatoleum toluvorans]|nr:site-specific integrase [Aromatoleum toluvorans]
MERGEYEPPRPAVTLAEAIDRYEREVLPSKRGAAQERYTLKAWRASALGRCSLATIKAADVAQARDKRLQEVSSGSVRRYLDTLSAVFEVAARDWEIVTANPVRAIRKPPNGRPRERRLLPGELERIIAASESPDFPAIVTLAAETAMRRSEILGLEWRYVDLRKRLVTLPLTKNGDSRTVPLTRKAVEVLSTLPRRIDGRVFDKNGTSLSGAFQRAVLRARRSYERERSEAGATAAEIGQDGYLCDLRLHDLRHERVSALVEGGFSLIEVAAISGHKTMQCLKRYSHVRPTHLVAKLDVMGSR